MSDETKPLSEEKLREWEALTAPVPPGPKADMRCYCGGTLRWGTAADRGRPGWLCLGPGNAGIGHTVSDPPPRALHELKEGFDAAPALIAEVRRLRSPDATALADLLRALPSDVVSGARERLVELHSWCPECWKPKDGLRCWSCYHSDPGDYP